MTLLNTYFDNCCIVSDALLNGGIKNGIKRYSKNDGKFGL